MYEWLGDKVSGKQLGWMLTLAQPPWVRRNWYCCQAACRKLFPQKGYGKFAAIPRLGKEWQEYGHWKAGTGAENKDLSIQPLGRCWLHILLQRKAFSVLWYAFLDRLSPYLNRPNPSYPKPRTRGRRVNHRPQNTRSSTLSAPRVLTRSQKLKDNVVSLILLLLHPLARLLQSSNYV